ncbi:2-oxo acid dehydrogenase subunit E2 [Nocardia brevicatena]|uniref:2-oxo acid dehydrogenase subunit E2 n=1 Tax=Nocardia brevicatena TaxID=37327 RepID=UPI00030E9219|nr:2-oxo acid dehydrogenase subunit E2 [Nocardia brevicatena]
MAVPQPNGHWVDDEFHPASAVHLGLMVSLHGGGMILPTIPDADTLSAAAMMGTGRDVVTRSRTARLRSSDVIPAGISVTDLGDMGRSVFDVIPRRRSRLSDSAPDSRPPSPDCSKSVCRPPFAGTREARIPRARDDPLRRRLPHRHRLAGEHGHGVTCRAVGHPDARTFVSGR